MFGPIVVLWLGTEAEWVAHGADVSAWASVRKLHAEPLHAEPPRAVGPRYDPALAEEVEALLEEARTTLTTPGAAPALERAEALLLEHPELPQAAWLLAERHALEARGAASGAPAGAPRRELSARAAQLEGARAATAGEAPEPLARDASPPHLPAPRALVPLAPRARDRVFIDGVDVSAPKGASFSVAPGRHHALLARGRASIWAGWVLLEPDRVVHLPDAGSACSALDLADVGAGLEAPEPAPGVRCSRWAVARLSSAAGIEIAECAAARCGPWQHAGRRRWDAALVAAPPGRELQGGGLPGWATWSLVGAGALAATGLVLWQAGALGGDDRETHFVFTGPSASAYQF